MPPQNYDLSPSIINYSLGQYQWYRRLVGGYWEWSNYTFRWRKYVPRNIPIEKVEDYRT